MTPLSYAEAGSGERAVVFIHGNFAGKSWWREILADPPDDSRLLAPDLPGFGESPGARSFTPSMRGYAASLARFLSDLEVRRPVLVGHSFGAAVATELAIAAPEKIPAMFLLSPAPLNGLQTPDFIYPMLAGYRRDRRGLRRALRRTMRTRTPPYLDSLVDEAAKMHPASFTANARIVAAWNVNGAARRYKNPVLVASGNRDTIVPPSSAEATARAFPAGRYVGLGEVGHSPQIEAPAAVGRLLRTLLRLTEEPRPSGETPLPRRL